MSWLEVLAMGLIAGIGACVLMVLLCMLVVPQRKGRGRRMRLSAAGLRPAQHQQPSSSVART